MTMPTAPQWYVLGRPCPQCGAPHSFCSSHGKGGDPCGSPPLEGSWLCSSHGGRAVTEMGALAPEQVDSLIDTYAQIGPLLKQAKVSTRGRSYTESIQDGLQRANAMVAMLEVLVSTLAARARFHTNLIGEGGPKERETYEVTTEGLIGPNHEGDLQAHPWVILLKEWTALQVQFASKASDLGLIERQVRVQEAQVSVVAEALMGVLSDLGIDLNDPSVQSVIETRLLAIDSTAIEVDTPMTAAATSS